MDCSTGTRADSVVGSALSPLNSARPDGFVNGANVAEGRIEKTTPFLFSADETADVGVDEATPVTEEYAERDNEFNGKIDKVTVELGTR